MSADPKTAQRILRHANSDVTMQIYTHAHDEAKKKALEKFEAPEFSRGG
jgi:integrase